MAFLSHSIPWHSLASLFEYRSSKAGPGPQHSGFYAVDDVGRTHQLEHFALRLQEVLCNHSASERRRFSPAEQYLARARTWNWSRTPEHRPAQSPVRHNVNTGGSYLQVSLTERNAELGNLQARLAGEESSTADPETRRVFSADFSTLYMSYVPVTSGQAYGREGLVEEFSAIETWIEFSSRYVAQDSASHVTADERNRVWLDEKSCSDVVRLLIIDAATTDDTQRRCDMLETVFLLIHHPDVQLDYIWTTSVACCNMCVGIKKLVTDTLSAFILLNLLWTYTDGTVRKSPLLAPCDEVDPACSDLYNSILPLLPRPAYMNAPSYTGLARTVLTEHGHYVETVFFNPLFAPYPSGRRSRYQNLPASPAARDEQRQEQDVLSNLTALKQSLKSMWKILVYCDMLFTEADREINWEFAVMESVSYLFMGKSGIARVLGQTWTEYEVDRMYEEGWRFFRPTKEQIEELAKRKVQEAMEEGQG